MAWRLSGKDVEGGTGNPAQRDRFGQGGLVDDAPSGGIDQPEPGLGVGQKFLADEAGRLGGLGDMNGEEIGLADQVVQGHQFGSHRSRPLGGQVRVISNEPHPEGQGPLRDQRSDPAEADDPEGLAVDLYAFPAGPFPAARLQRRVRLGDIARLRQQESHGVLGGGEDVRLRGVDHHHPPSGGSGDVHIVEADPRPTDYQQLAPRRQDLVIDLGGRPDYERRRARDSLEEVPVRQAQPDVDMVARLSQEVEAGLGDFLGHQDAGHGGHGPTKGIGGPVACTASGRAGVGPGWRRAGPAPLGAAGPPGVAGPRNCHLSGCRARGLRANWLYA